MCAVMSGGPTAQRASALQLRYGEVRTVWKRGRYIGAIMHSASGSTVVDLPSHAQTLCLKYTFVHYVTGRASGWLPKKLKGAPGLPDTTRRISTVQLISGSTIHLLVTSLFDSTWQVMFFCSFSNSTFKGHTKTKGQVLHEYTST